MYTPEHLKLWSKPQHYVGAVWPGYYSAGVGQSRDSSALERSNFECMLRELGGESETVTVVHEGHWAVGWVEWIAIHQDDERALQVADEIAGALKDYPVVDEGHWSDLEYNEAADYWNGLTPREKVRYAMEERARYHWMGDVAVWQFGRLSWGDMDTFECRGLTGDDERATIARALEESLRHN